MTAPIPRPAKVGGAVLYLDFDGVLHHEDVRSSAKRGIFFGPEAQATGRQHRLFEHCALLEELLSPYPSVQIVLSTSWSRVQGFSRASSHLTAPLRQRVVGATYHSGMNKHLFLEASRGLQVWSDVCRRMPDQWLAIDDDPFGWPARCRGKLICTDANLGLSEPGLHEEAARKFETAYMGLQKPDKVRTGLWKSSPAS